MPITPEQAAAHDQHVGGSDLPAIMGVDPYRNAEEVRLAKTGRLAPAEANDAMRAGTWLEDGVLNYAEAKLGPLQRNVEAVVEALPILVVHTDGLVLSSLEPVEAKTAGITHDWANNDEWGDEGTDQVPDRVIVQAHGHMLAHQTDVCHVPALLGRRGLVMFAVPFSQALGDLILTATDTFWRVNVQGDTPCECGPPSLEVLKRVRRQPEKVIDLDEAGVEAVQTYLNLSAEVKALEKAAKAAKAAVLNHLGDAEAATCGDLGAVTFMEQTRCGYVVEPTTYRVLRHKTKGL